MSEDKKICEENITVALISRDTASNIALLESACFSCPWSQKAVEDSFDNGTVFFGAFYQDSMIGYCGLQTVYGEGYITNIAVYPDFRRLGAGRALMKSLISYARENNLVFLTLEVRCSNTPAIRLYESAGFVKAGTRKNFYCAPQEDAIIMTRQMNHENSCN